MAIVSAFIRFPVERVAVVRGCHCVRVAVALCRRNCFNDRPCYSGSFRLPLKVSDARSSNIRVLDLIEKSGFRIFQNAGLRMTLTGRSGPLYKSHVIVGETIRVKFDHAQHGLLLAKF
jgi:hypothetical protein